MEKLQRVLTTRTRPIRIDAGHVVSAFADVLVSTDEIDPNRDSSAGRWGSASELNTGVLFFRANQRAIDFTLEWRERMAAIKGDAQIDDQLTFNQLVGTVWSNARSLAGVPYPNTNRPFYPIRAASPGVVIPDARSQPAVRQAISPDSAPCLCPVQV